jgi:hypothetical protein
VPALPGIDVVTDIGVDCEPAAGGWSCTVRLSDGASATEHTVRVTASDLARLAPNATEPSDLIRHSFEFLLEREPKESILRSFGLPVIGRYFPEYERTIRRG